MFVRLIGVGTTMNIFKTIAVVAFASFVGVGAASAATLNYIGNISGNPDFSGANPLLVLDPADFNVNERVVTPLLWKCDTGGSESQPTCNGSSTSNFDGTLDGNLGGRDGSTGIQSGWFSLTDAGSKLVPHYLVIKGANNASVYEILGDLSLMTNFSNSDLPNAGGSGKPPAISNISLWNTGQTVIPLPAAGWLLIGGLGALGLARRRKS